MKLLIMQFLPNLLSLHRDPKILLSTLFSNALSLCPSLMSETKYRAIENHRRNYSRTYSMFQVFEMWSCFKGRKEENLPWEVNNLKS
jgi:hypothetical protein